MNFSRISPTKNSVGVIKHLMARLYISCHQPYVGMLQESTYAVIAYRKRYLQLRLEKNQATFWHIIYMTVKLIGIKLWILSQTKLLQKSRLSSCQIFFTQLSHLKKSWLGCWCHFAHVSTTLNQTLDSWAHPKKLFYIITCIHELGSLVCVVSYTRNNCQVLPLFKKKKKIVHSRRWILAGFFQQKIL